MILTAMQFFRHFQNKLSLRVVNLIGLSMVFACLMLSAGYIKRELSYDRHHAIPVNGIAKT